MSIVEVRVVSIWKDKYSEEAEGRRDLRKHPSNILISKHQNIDFIQDFAMQILAPC